MSKRQDEFEGRGARIVAVGQGSGPEAARFCRMLGARFDCLGDETRAVYERYELPRGSWGDVTWRPLLRDPLRGLARTFRADLKAGAAPASDVRQLGGVALVARGGRMRFLFRQVTSADLPDTRALLDAVERLVSERGSSG